ncbi:hypothetical protein, partial [Modestobacter marinus]|uniref:hypothetical protein n=1 Tax=Modestobacter marinus TaxID=477641 RepID=UPI001FB96470
MSASALRGSSCASSARIRIASGVRVSRPATYWLDRASTASRSAAWPWLVPQQPQEPLVVAQRLADLAVGQQAGVGVGAGREGLQQHRQQVALHRRRPAQPTGERGEVPQRAVGVGEAQRPQPLPRRLRAQLQLLAGHPGDRGQQRP